MNRKLAAFIPYLLIDIWIFLSVFLQNSDLKAVVVLFLVEMIIFGIFRFIRRTRGVEPKKGKFNFHNTLTNEIASAIVYIGAAAVLLIGINRLEYGDLFWQIIKANLIIIAFMLFVEALGLMHFFLGEKKKDITFYYGYVKIFLIGIILYILTAFRLSLSMDEALNSVAVLAITFFLAKTATDYFIVSAETTSS